MKKINIAQIKSAALAATSGPWVMDGEGRLKNGNLNCIYVAHQDSGRICEVFRNCLVNTNKKTRANARFISLVNPQTTLAMIAEIERLQSENAQLTTECATKGEFINGEPPHPWNSEWFIAKLKDGSYGILRTLPEEHSYHYTTVDHTYYTRDWVVAWAQLPFSEFVSYAKKLRSEGAVP